MARRNRYMFSRGDRYNLERAYKNVPYEEFVFYNNSKNFVEEDKLKEIYTAVTAKRESVYWTNEDFGKIGIVFRFKIKEIVLGKSEKQIRKLEWRRGEMEKDDPKDEEQKIEGVYVDIMEFGYPITPQFIESVKDILRDRLFLGFNVDEDTRLLFELFNYDRIALPKAKLFTSFKEIIAFFIVNKFMNEYKQNESYSEFKEDIDTLFGPQNIDYREPEINTNSSYGDIDTHFIFHVIECRINEKNYRIALISEQGSYRSHFEIKVFDEENEEYNFIDKNRVFFFGNHYNSKKRIFLDLATNRYTPDGNIEINKPVLEHLERDISQLLAPNERQVNANMYGFYFERYGNRVLNVRKDKQFEQLKERYVALIEEGREIKINNIIIHKNYIKLGDEFSMEFGDDFLNVADNLTSIREAVNIEGAQYNLNTVYENILKISTLKYVQLMYSRESVYKQIASIKFKVNGMLINVSRKDSRVYINDIFSRIDDTYSILCRAICYSNVHEYNRFIKDVSYIGVEWKKMINNGIAIELYNPFYELFKKTGRRSFEKILMRFSLLWDATRRTRVYLVANNKRYLIRYKGKFKRYMGLPSIVMSMDDLKKILTECLGQFDVDVFVALIQNAIKEGEIIKKRGEELVQNTLKETFAEETVIEVRGNEIKGFKLVGRATKAPYFVNAVTLEVYKFTDGQWNRRCVVDDPNKQRIFEDRLANRLVNIYNEYKGISTIKD